SAEHGPWARPIRQRGGTDAHRAAAGSRATGAGRPPHQGVAARRRVRFFLTVTPNRSISNQSVLSAALVGSASRNSAKVASGRAVISAARRSSRPAKTRDRNFVCLRGASEPVSRRRWISRCTQARLTSYFAAIASASGWASQALATRFRKSIEYGAIGPPATGVPRRRTMYKSKTL